MVHSSVRSVGYIVGGVNVLVQALFDAIGPDGTLSAYIDVELCYDEDDDPADIPVFDKRIAHAARDHGILHETLRNWPGALRSDHPDAGVIANGRLAAWLIGEHPLQYGYGEGSPYEKIVEARGKILMIGAPLDTISLLHYAEHLADIPEKRVRRYRRFLVGADGPVWVDFEEFDTCDPVAPYLPDNVFERIAQDYLAAGFGREERIGQAASHLFDAPICCGSRWSGWSAMPLLDRIAVDNVSMRRPSAGPRPCHRSLVTSGVGYIVDLLVDEGGMSSAITALVGLNRRSAP
jgi:aminoglycoside 3-N-acetyltransferase